MAACHFTVRWPLNRQGQTLSSLSMSHTKYSDSNSRAQCRRKSESYESVHLLMLLELAMTAVIHRAGLQWLSSCLIRNYFKCLSKFSICVHSCPQNTNNLYAKSLMCSVTTSCHYFTDTTAVFNCYILWIVCGVQQLPHGCSERCIKLTLVTPRVA